MERQKIRAELISQANDEETIFEARFVRAGQIRAQGNQVGDIVIPELALIDALDRGLFDGKAVFIDHSLQPSLMRLIGTTEGANWNEQEKSIDGRIKLFSIANTVGVLINEILEQEPDKRPDVGLSIVFWPTFTNEKNKRVVDSIHHVESIDLVFEPAADGRITNLLSSLEQRSDIEMEEDKVNVNDNLEDWKTAAARAATSMLLNASDLPAISKERLSLVSYESPEAVKAAIEIEQAYIAKLHENSVIQLGSTAPRGGNIQVGMDGLERISIALEALLSGRQPDKVAPLSGIREAYIHLSGDYEMTGVFNPERIGLANVTSSTMAGLVANALNKAVINAFQAYPRWWEKIVTVEDFGNLQQVKWITLGGVGELPTVGEGAAYTELTWDDQTETATFVKKGGYLGITLEAIDKDDTRKVQAAPRALAQAAWLTLSKSISAIFTSAAGLGPTMSDSVALFDAAHGNLGSTALSITEYAVVRTAMRKQTELNSAERLGALTAPKYLLVPPDLEITALQVLGSDLDYTYALANAPGGRINPLSEEGSSRAARMSFARDRVVVVDLWTDTNNWAAVADPMLYPSIGLGFRYGRTPEIFSVASPTAGLMFTNDVMPVKVRFFYAVGPTDWRGLYKENVA